ncbi:hypothetical protein VE01_10771 [Pseudogymnoascus verrucosus]|uniref:Uncharacterized protein n=1 Tax=Pseudogymnoascus verrucosus TaxID=342668 RepID=A0A2P6FGV7_9PEZI|nr:uncharacterized protein VE01_10771 [Pseudogymnoascus verrucosus]PQM43875.1 hypothetical protein VE01_10771 [Pseudogymnoascus verrucosus]
MWSVSAYFLSRSAKGFPLLSLFVAISSISSISPTLSPRRHVLDTDAASMHATTAATDAPLLHEDDATGRTVYLVGPIQLPPFLPPHLFRSYAHVDLTFPLTEGGGCLPKPEKPAKHARDPLTSTKH